MKILVVDDEDALRYFLKSKLTRAGHEVWEAENGQVALAIWQRESIRIVITDWMMPVMDGPDLIREIRTSTSHDYTYIILLTVWNDEESVAQQKKVNANDFLTKPFRTDDVLERVKKAEHLLSNEKPSPS
jgi:sigma-B regulation protein RsbU (phosphoserine phosphatase)